MRSGNPTAAIAQLQKLLDEHSGADVAGAGCFQLAQLQFRQRAFDDARVNYQRYIDDYGDDQMLVAASYAGMAAGSILACAFTSAPAPAPAATPLPQSLPADTSLINGKVITVDSKDSAAQAIAVKDGLIQAVGTTAAMRALAGGKTLIFAKV